MIRFNIPFVAGKEIDYINESIASGRLSGNGKFTKLCNAYFENSLGSSKTLLTTSCTDALEMSAILCQIGTGDEVIIPSYTFVSTANAFVLRGAKIVFADSESDFPDIDASRIEPLINQNTKAIVVVHYAGGACDMDAIMALAKKYNLFVIEDAAQCIDSYYNQKPLGSIGHFGAFSFHDTKNIVSGEGGLLAVNDEKFVKRAEIIWEKGTNRSAFYRGEVDKYTWIDIGSSYLPSELNAAFLYAQLENLESIQKRRLQIWHTYYQLLSPYTQEGVFELMDFKKYQTNNAHLFYILLPGLKERDTMIYHLREAGISGAFHYLTLHDSPYFLDKHDGRILKNAKRFEHGLIRLPLYPDLNDQQIEYISEQVLKGLKQCQFN